MIEITIGNDKLCCLVDTGSSTTLLDESKLPQYKRRTLKHPLKFNTLNTNTLVNKEIITNLPCEFQEDAYMCWKLTKFHNKLFDGIIGQNLLKPLGAIVDMKNDVVIINNNEIRFKNSCPYKSEEIHQLDITELDENIKNELHKNLNAEEGNHLRSLLKSYSDLFFKEGETLSCTNEIEHEIVTTISKPIYSKIYRYPRVHEQ